MHESDIFDHLKFEKLREERTQNYNCKFTLTNQSQSGEINETNGDMEMDDVLFCIVIKLFIHSYAEAL